MGWNLQPKLDFCDFQVFFCDLESCAFSLGAFVLEISKIFDPLPLSCLLQKSLFQPALPQRCPRHGVVVRRLLRVAPVRRQLRGRVQGGGQEADQEGQGAAGVQGPDGQGQDAEDGARRAPARQQGQGRVRGGGEDGDALVHGRRGIQEEEDVPPADAVGGISPDPDGPVD